MCRHGDLLHGGAGERQLTGQALIQHTTQRAGELWTDSGLVFTDEFGGPVNPRAVLRAVQRSADRAGIADVTVHTLRHSAAVAWLEAGVHIKAVADLLGHSGIAITGDIYGHASDAATRSAVDGLSEALGL
jgi:integrase